MSKNIQKDTPVKAVALISGGLDSTLAAIVIKRQDVEIHGLHFIHAFNSDVQTFLTAGEMEIDGKTSGKRLYNPPAQLKLVSEQLDIPLQAVELTGEITELVKKPRYGYGKHLNPCIDCRILQLKIAKNYMDEIGADFIITGEVVGQRPMSQRRQAIEQIDRRAEMQGLVLRPLTAQRLEPTIPEQRGWIDQSKLYGISGRSRKEQKKLAEEMGISDYPESGGGCRLTYEGFARKMKDLIDHKNPDINDTFLLQAGRHFRTSKTGKAIVGKDENDNEILKKLTREGDMLFEVHDGRGPTVLLRDGDSELDINLAAGLCVSHVKVKGSVFGSVRCWKHGSEKTGGIDAAPLERAKIEKMRI